MKKTLAATLLLTTMSLHADGIIAVLKNPSSVERRDAKTGSFKGSISVSGKPIAVQVSGGVIAVTTERSLNRYNAKSGSYMGSSSL
jgi:hypothetical protein